ncbi:hypothetical protein JMM81_14180 [Bacillus sp. V3B]|nr:hypothetical protein [Bacillus sp. V3B]MCQ6276078.1 hypothetical protein [Bacillus sp. V3B]
MINVLAKLREMIIEPKWVEKVENSQENEIHTTLSKTDQKVLVIPDPL